MRTHSHCRRFQQPSCGSDDDDAERSLRRSDHRGRSARDRRGSLRLFLPADHDGRHPPATDQHEARLRARRPDEPVRERPGIPGRRYAGRRPPQLRHALFERLAGPDQGAGRRLRPRHRRPLLPPAHARHVDGRLRFARLADDRHRCRQLPGDAARLAARSPRQVRRVQAAQGHPADRCADALRLDHRPHQDRRPVGLRCGPQDPGGLQDHPALAMGQGAQAPSNTSPIRPST